jgi:hypothetical protein
MDDGPKPAFAQVKAWLEAGRGISVVPSIDHADVLLELHDCRPTTTSDGTPGEEWLFIARRLAEPDSNRATYRFSYVTLLDRTTKAHVARALPAVLSDVCLGYLPKAAAAE